MLEVDFDDLDLGSKRKPTEWVAVLPASAQQPRQRSSRQLLKAQKMQQAHKKQQEDKPQGAVKKQGTPVSTHAARMQQLAECTDVRQPRPISEEDAAAGAQAFPAENDEGNVEYKLRLKEPNCSPVRFQQLVTQMKYRLAEGNGECFYFIGVEDDGYPRGLIQTDMDISLATLRAMSEEVHAATTLLRKAAGTRKRQCAIVRVHKLCVDDVTYTDLRIAVAGSVDAGKSSLVGVLTHGIDGRPLLDNGCGSARMNVFQHKHEIETGRTSSLSQQMLGYDEEGKVLNYAGVSVLTPAEMSASARRVLRFIDLGGHEKYLKTALYGMTCMLPDYVLVCVCPLSGLSRVSHEHLAVALALEVPVACVITKADVAPAEAVEQVLQDVRRVIGAAAEVSQPKQSAVGVDVEGGAEASQEAAPHVTHESQAVKLARQLGQHRCLQPQHLGQGSSTPDSRLMVPIFVVSSVTGTGLPVLHAFLNALPALPHAATPLLDPILEGGSGPVRHDCASEIDPAAKADIGLDEDHMADAKRSANGQQRTDVGVLVNGHQRGTSLAAVNGQPKAAPTVMSNAQQKADLTVGLMFGVNGQHQLNDTSIMNDHLSAYDSPHAGYQQTALTHFQVDHTFEVKGVGCVVSGTVVTGEVAVGQKLNLGPTGEGGFREVQVTCIHRSQVPVRHVMSGQHATVALHPCNMPLQPSQATQHFSHPSPVTSFAPPVTNGSHTQFDASASPDGNQQRAAQLELGRKITAGKQQGGLHQACVGLTDNTEPQASVPGTQQQTLPVGMMSQALNAQAQAVPDAPCQQQQDRYILDHRIHHETAGDTCQRQAAATAVGKAEVPKTTAARCMTPAAAIAVPSRVADSTFTPSLHGWRPSGSNEQGPQHAQHGAESCSPALVGPSPPNARKGMVLLDTAMHTRTVWQFGAVIVLLNGHWPPRGLLSGRWPPKPDTPDTVLSTSSLSESPLGASDSDPDTTSPVRPGHLQADLAVRGRSGGLVGSESQTSSSVGRGCRYFDRPSKKRQSAVYTPVIHCGSVRQAAQVLSMEEVKSSDSVSPSSSSSHIVEGCNLASAIAAAVVMQDYTTGSSVLGSAPSGSNMIADGFMGDEASISGSNSAVGTLTRVVFKFQHRPEWLMEGSRIILRDRTDGCTAGAGVIRKLVHFT